MADDGFILLPPEPGKCPTCACDHHPSEPHNADSLFFKYRFFANQGRWPCWSDAIAHCDPELQAAWKEALKARGVWSEPDSEVPDVLPTPRRTIGTVEKEPPEIERVCVKCCRPYRTVAGPPPHVCESCGT